MKVGLYFGSFNPVHIGHCIIASYFVQNTDLDKVWLVVSPQNPFKESASLLNEYHRLHLAKLATEDETDLKSERHRISFTKTVLYHRYAYLSQRKIPGTPIFHSAWKRWFAKPAQMEKRSFAGERPYIHGVQKTRLRHCQYHQCQAGNR